MRRSLFSSIVAGLLMAPVAAFAQEADEDGEGQRTGRQIEEVVVTAERRESTVQDTAISITAFTGEFIEDFGLRNQEDLQNYLPATTIQPYDLSIRGVGRLFRALGGDPGVATYFDGAYSEDFGIASTEGGLFDIERIEVLRGPQGTLYGRNGVGGAVNFHSKKPTDEFEGEVRGVYGSYDTKEIFGVVSGPIIKDVLNARATGVKRTRDGFMNDVQPGNPDINNYGDENYSLSLEWKVAENFNVLVRGNERSYRRMMSGAQGAGAILVSEQAGMPDPVTGGKRWVSVPVTGLEANSRPELPGCHDVRQRNRPFNAKLHRAHGSGALHQRRQSLLQLHAQRRNPMGAACCRRRGSRRASHRTAPPSLASQGPTTPIRQPSTPPPKRWRSKAISATAAKFRSSDSGDLDAWTSGLQDEFFDHQAAYMNITWDLLDNLTIKYIGAYTDYFYDRTTDDDRTGLPMDQQFYAAQENENFQHEVQFFLDIGDDLNFTGGYFYYENDIDQQLDFYSPDGWTRYTEAADYGVAGATAYLGWRPDFGGSRLAAQWRRHHHQSPNGAELWAGLASFPTWRALVAIPSFSHPSIDEVYFADNPWIGDTFATGGRVDHGPVSDGTTFIWDTENRTKAWAVYLQGEWQMTELFALTLGVRYAEDDKEAEENLFLYNESPTALATCVTNVAAAGLAADACGDIDGDGAVSLAEYNQGITGGIDATRQHRRL